MPGNCEAKSIVLSLYLYCGFAEVLSLQKKYIYIFYYIILNNWVCKSEIHYL
jgi:hypothetical protein